MGIFEVILAFMEKGGNVLWLIAALVFFMWTLIFERVWYFTSVWKADRAAVVSAWKGVASANPGMPRRSVSVCYRRVAS